MKLKLDENLGDSARRYLEHAGYDVSTVALQKLCGTDDRHLIAVCAAEDRCLITLDLDFSNPCNFELLRMQGLSSSGYPSSPPVKTSSTVWRRSLRLYQWEQTLLARSVSSAREEFGNTEKNADLWPLNL